MNISRPMVQDAPPITGGLTGWAALEDHVRKSEERTVQDYKEDMDALLVFAGLYSAVLIGLLVESFHNLQKDPQQETVQLLRQISAQTNSYTLVGSHLNSTVPFSDPTAAPFEAQATDILVNICWFASLILSLAAASFAILVKQWLKEYLAIDRSRPEERLRIRYFRQGGLETWKLFEIAAVLPLVLQLALTLFFLGLCSFTASVHRSIGATCICLVGGWAAFFAFALLAPILSPRCPYKTTFLKRVLSTIRVYMLSIAKYSLAHPESIRIRRCLSILAASSRLLVVAAVLRVREHVPKLTASLKLRALAVLVRVHQYFLTLVASLGLAAVVQRTLQVAEDAIRLARWQFATLYHAIWQNTNNDSKTLHAPKYRLNEIKNNVVQHEESQICCTNEKDAIIVTDIDATVNDELLVPMELALRHTRPPLKDIIHFTIGSVQRRLNMQNLRDEIQAIDLDGWFTPLQLLDATRIPVINIVADSLHAAVNQAPLEEPIHTGDREQAELAWRFLVTLLTDWEQAMPGRVLELMCLLSSRGMFAGCKYDLCRTGEHIQGFPKVVSNIYDVLRTLRANQATGTLKVFFQCYFWKGDPQDTRISLSLLEKRLAWSDLLDGCGVPCGSLIALTELALSAVVAAHYQRRTAGEILTLPPGEMALIGFVLDAIPLIFETRPDHDFDKMTVPGASLSPLEVLKWLFYWSDTLPQILDCIMARSDVLLAGKSRDLLLIRPIILPLNPWKQYTQAKRESGSPLSLVSTLLLCCMVCHRTDWDEDHPVLLWHAICEDFIFVIDRALITSSHSADSVRGGHLDLTKEPRIALDILRDFDDPGRDGIDGYRDRAPGASPHDPDNLQNEDEQYSRWRDEFDVDKSWYTDGLIQRLLSIVETDTVVDKDGFMSWRVRRLKDIRDGRYKPVIVGITYPTS